VIKCRDHVDDDPRMGRHPIGTIEEERSPHTGTSESDTSAQAGIAADAERVNKAGPWPYPGFGNTWRWIRETMDAGEE